MAAITQSERAQRLRSLHVRGRPLLLPNAWDAGSARLFAGLGFDAIATTSGGLAWSLGHADGEQLPLAEVLAAVRRIVRVTELPVSVDFEGGYGRTPAEVADSVRAMLEAGAAGINLEDGIGHAKLREPGEAAERIAAARAAAEGAGVPLVINARVDVWLLETGESVAKRLDEALRRARAYLAAGADCVYPIGLADRDTIGSLVSALAAPVNVGVRPGLPALDELARLGVARVSTATRLALVALSAARDAAQALRRSGRLEAPDGALTYADLQRLFTHP